MVVVFFDYLRQDFTVVGVFDRFAGFSGFAMVVSQLLRFGCVFNYFFYSNYSGTHANRMVAIYALCIF